MKKIINFLIILGIVVFFVPEVHVLAQNTNVGYNFGIITLRNGSRGEAVKELQRFLNQVLSLGLVVDGKLGPKTIIVIKKWQSDHNLTSDGLIGPKTKAMMNASVVGEVQNTTTPSITVISPNGGENFSPGLYPIIKWSGPSTLFVDIALTTETGSVVGYIYSHGTSLAYNSIGWDVINLSSYVGGPNNLTVSPGKYKIKISTGSGSTYKYDISDAPFTVSTSAATPLVITTNSLSNPKVGIAYKAYLYATSGQDLYSWSVSSGSLPSGLTLSASSDCGASGSTTSNVTNCILIVGTPTTAGTNNFTLAVTSGVQSTSKQFSLTVNPADVVPTSSITIVYPNTDRSSYDIAQDLLVAWTNSIPVTSTTTFLFQLNAVNVSGYTSGQTIISKTLTSVQAGCGYATGDQCAYFPFISLGTSGGTYTAMVKNLQSNASDSVTFTVNGSTTIPPISITTSSPLPNAKVGQAYSINLSATGGTGLYGWYGWGSSSFPPGLTGTINNSGITSITGTPTTGGTYTFNLTATSGTQSVSKQFTLTVNSADGVSAETPTIISILPTGYCSTSVNAHDILLGFCLSRTSANFGETVYIYGSGFNSNSGINMDGISLNSGNFPVVFISANKLSFVIPYVLAGPHSIRVSNTQTDGSPLLSNIVNLNFVSP